MEEKPKFGVFVTGPHGESEEDRSQARRATADELKQMAPLSPGAKDAARVLKMADEDMQRFILASKLAKERLEKRTAKFGSAIESIIGGLGPDYTLDAVFADLGKVRWIARLRTPKGVMSVAIPWDLGEDVVDWDLIQAKEQVKVLLLTNLERPELTGGRQ